MRKLTTVEEAFNAVREICEAEEKRAERYREALATLLVNARRDASSLAPYLVPFCEAILDGKTVADAILAMNVEPTPAGQAALQQGGGDA